MQDQTLYSQIKPQFPEQEHLKCPRCDSSNTKFCYYNNYNLSQPRHFCKNCRRYWTKGGALRNIPVGGGSRKNTKRSSSASTAKRPSSSSSSTTSSVPASSSSAAAAAAATSSSPILPKPEPLVATTPGLGGTFDQDRRLLEVNGSFSSLLASSVTGGQYGNLLQGLNLNPNGPNLQLCGGFLDHGPSPTQDSGQTAPAPDHHHHHHHHHQNGSGSRRNGNSDLQMGLQNDSVSDGFLSLQGGEDSSSCWNGSNGWPDLAIYTPGYAGKMNKNMGHDVTYYEVTDSGDDALNPKLGTLRYGMTQVKGKVWVTFQKDMNITLQKPLLVRSFSVIDGRGASVHIAGGGCLLLHRATNVIIHGIRIHDCKAQEAGAVMGPEGNIIPLGTVDGDAIRLVTCSNIWIDHNTLYDCEDGLIDVTRGSTNVTISNNWFRYQNKVMLLGHDDGYRRDKDMKVTVAFNHFGPHCRQRMPRIRFGYAHVVNNLYLGWGLYAIGGSMNPSIKSQANLFIAPNEGKKEVTWRKHNGDGMSWNFRSVEDVFENGASFLSGGDGGAVRPNYNEDQSFPVSNAGMVRALTKSAGALRCSKASRC